MTVCISRPSNTALQRTRSAPLRSPLSFKTFGAGGKLGSMLLAAALSVSLGVVGCSAHDCKQVGAPEQISSVGLRPPPEFWKTHKEGDVTLEIHVDAQGSVSRVHVLRTSGPDYTAVAVESVKQWQYRPAMCDGRPVPIDVTVSVRFTAEEAKK